MGDRSVGGRECGSAGVREGVWMLSERTQMGGRVRRGGFWFADMLYEGCGEDFPVCVCDKEM